MSDRIAVMRGGRSTGVVARAEATPLGILALALGEAGGPARMSPAPATSGSWRRPWPGRSLLALVDRGRPSFFSADNLRDLALNNAPLLLVATGMTLVILVGQIDISVGSQFAIVSVCAGLLAKAGAGSPLLLAGVLALGAALGAVNGLLVGRSGLPSIIVTLATMVAWRDGLRWATEGAWVQDLPAGLPVVRPRAGGGTGADRRGGAGCARVPELGRCATWWPAAPFTPWAPTTRPRASPASSPPASLFSVFVAHGRPHRPGRAPERRALLRGPEQHRPGARAEGGGRGRGRRDRDPRRAGHPRRAPSSGVGLLGTIGPALTFAGINPFWEKAVQGAIILGAPRFGPPARTPGAPWQSRRPLRPAVATRAAVAGAAVPERRVGPPPRARPRGAASSV